MKQQVFPFADPDDWRAPESRLPSLDELLALKDEPEEPKRPTTTERKAQQGKPK